MTAHGLFIVMRKSLVCGRQASTSPEFGLTRLRATTASSSDDTNHYAGLLFTDAERHWNTATAQQIEQALPETQVLLPQDFCPPPPDFAAIFQACVDHLDQADRLQWLMEQTQIAVPVEAGYAYAKNIPVVSLRTDWRPAEDDGGNCMLRRSVLVQHLSQVISAIANECQERSS